MLLLLSLIVIVSYVGMMVMKGGIPSSVSDTYYILKHKLWFGFSMLSTAILLVPYLLNATPESYQFTAFLMCAGLMIVGVAPNFKEEYERKIHISGALISGVCSQIWLLFTQPWLLCMWVVFLLYVLIAIKLKSKGNIKNSFMSAKLVFWAEIVCFSSVFTALIIT